LRCNQRARSRRSEKDENFLGYASEPAIKFISIFLLFSSVQLDPRKKREKEESEPAIKGAEISLNIEKAFSTIFHNLME
jgi:hypothetical protein